MSNNMFSLQNLIKALRRLQTCGFNGDLVSLKNAASAASKSFEIQQQQTTPALAALLPTKLAVTTTTTTAAAAAKQRSKQEAAGEFICHSCALGNGSVAGEFVNNVRTTCAHDDDDESAAAVVSAHSAQEHKNLTTPRRPPDSENHSQSAVAQQQHFSNRSRQIQKFYQQQLHQFHTQNMSSLAAEPLSERKPAAAAPSAEEVGTKTQACRQAGKGDDNTKAGCNNSHNGSAANSSGSDDDGHKQNGADAAAAGTSLPAAATTSGKEAAAKSGLAEMLQFMELIGNLKHTKRTGWVLRDVNDCESISGHMYRMSMLTFLLDGSEGLNQVRCMQLALVHDLAESVVGDLTPFCGVSRGDKRAMEFKAMEDICKLIEPRGKLIMELFEEYELGESAESKFVKDLDRLDMVMQAFEYEKRDNCLLKHQEFFDSTEGKFNHPFVRTLVEEIYVQRKSLAEAKGAKPPETVVVVPDWDVANETNGHAEQQNGTEVKKKPAAS